jgi:putative protease
METPIKRGRGRPRKTEKVEAKETKTEAKAEVKETKAITEKTEIGKVTHFFGGISVAVIELSKPLKQGDSISIEGASTNFQQKVESMQIENTSLKEAKAGQSIGMKVKDRVREHDVVYKL